MSPTPSNIPGQVHLGDPPSPGKGPGEARRASRHVAPISFGSRTRSHTAAAKGQRPIADEVNKLSRFDAEIHMPTSVSALAELMVRIHSPPAKSRANSTCRSKKRQGAAA